MRISTLITSLALSIRCTEAFSVASTYTDRSSSAVLLAHKAQADVNADASSMMNRRDALRNSVLALASGVVASGATPPKAFAEEGAMGSSPEHPIVVLGAGGRCGLLCTDILAKKGLYVKAVTRSGRSVLDESNKFVSYGAGDVTKPASIADAVSGASGVIFAASASKKGGDAAHVDYLGVANTADACIAKKVPKLAVISSGAVTRPTSIGFKITNVFGRIMDYKIAGETELRNAYAAANDTSLKYTIIRPGGLSDEESKGPSGVEVSQGDILSAEIGREDVAAVTVAALLSSATDNVSLECYGSGGETLFGQKTGPSKLAKDLPDPSKYKHLSGVSYEQLFDGVLNDADMRKTGIVSDYVGVKVEPLASLL